MADELERGAGYGIVADELEWRSLDLGGDGDSDGGERLAA